MIDFRYHIVSLISVFLALAVGIALGAGPLKDSIGDTLTGQVDQLRAEKDDLRVELDRTAGALDDEQAAFAAVAPDLVEGILPGYRVAVITVGPVDAGANDGVVAQLAAAGATVTAQVAVTQEWTDPARSAFRGTLAGTLVEYLDPSPAADSGTAVELAEALVQALTTASATDVDAISENSGVILDLLSGEAGLVTVQGSVTTAADAVVVLAGPVVAEDPEAVVETSGPSTDPSSEASATPSVEADTEADAESDAATEEADAATQLAQAAQARSTGMVLAGGATTGAGALDAVRSSSDLTSVIATVDDVQGLTGQVSVPMALSARIAGTVGHYGTGELTTAVMPGRVALPPIVRVPAAPDAASDAPSAAPEG